MEKARNVADLDDLAPSRAIRRLLKPIPPRFTRIVSSTGWLGLAVSPNRRVFKSEVRASEKTARKIDWPCPNGNAPRSWWGMRYLGGRSRGAVTRTSGS